MELQPVRRPPTLLERCGRKARGSTSVPWSSWSRRVFERVEPLESPFFSGPLCPPCPCILRGLGSLSLTSPRSPLASPSKAGLRSPQRAKERDEDSRHDRPFVLCG